MLGPKDMDNLELHLWPDADWNGTASTTRSTSGLFLELCGYNSQNKFPLTWKTQFQKATSSSSAESETVSVSTSVRHVGIPVQDLLCAMLGMQIPVMIAIDNTQAIAAIKNGYSKKLKSLNRQHRVSIGAMNELYLDPEAALEVEYVKTDVQKGDSFTKALGPQVFIAAREKAGYVKASRQWLSRE